MVFRPQKIISGGQTGADVGALTAANFLGISTGGWAPRGYLTEKGPQPVILGGLGLRETESGGYSERTLKNIFEADATLILARVPNSRGTLQTIKMAMAQKRAFWIVDPAANDAHEQVCAFLAKHQPGILNVAGNRESVAPGIAQEVINLLLSVLSCPQIQGLQTAPAVQG